MPDLTHTIAYAAVYGAVQNVLSAHPKWVVPPEFARSVAKRAAGTLMAHAGPSLLASARKSGQRKRFPTGATSDGRHARFMATDVSRDIQGGLYDPARPISKMT